MTDFKPGDRVHLKSHMETYEFVQWNGSDAVFQVVDVLRETETEAHWATVRDPDGGLPVHRTVEISRLIHAEAGGRP